MVFKAPQPCVESVSASGAMARHGARAYITVRDRRNLYDTQARGSQRDIV